ncbi:MAG: hypothetical protein HYS09_03850 [Chloroflexi bacterium]|nr:hypothetical protein [Chloroflexota bacterium]
MGRLKLTGEPEGVTDHGLLDGLTDDDHPPYALLSGRAGGQTLSGGSGPGEGLSLQSTAHATRGKVIVPDTLKLAGLVIEDAADNERLRLSAASPHVTLSGDIRAGDRAGINVAPGDAARLSLSEASGTISPTGGIYDIINASLAATLGKTLSTYRPLVMSGLLNMAGFNITTVLGLFFGPTVAASGGLGSAVTTFDAVRAAGNVRGGTAGEALAMTTLRGLAVLGPTVGAPGTSGLTVTDWIGLAITRPSVFPGASVTNRIALDIADQSGLGSSTNYSIRALGTAPSIHEPPITIGASSPPAANVKLDVAGGLALRRSDFTAVNGNNHNIAVGSAGFVRVTGPTAAFIVTGIVGGVDGRILILYNDAGQDMTIAHLNAGSSAANQIRTMAAADITTTGRGAAILVYDSNASQWVAIVVTT